MDILKASDRLSKILIKEGYCGKKISSGFNFVTGERDFQNYKTDKILTKEIAQSYCPKDFIVTSVKYYTNDHDRNEKYEYVSVSLKDE